MDDKRSDVATMRHIATFCDKNCGCGSANCPEVYLNEQAPPHRRVVIADDFGQRIEMSIEQLRTLVDDVRAGVLDQVLAATS